MDGKGSGGKAKKLLASAVGGGKIPNCRGTASLH